MTVLATGLGLGESPRWHDGRLWVCDWLAGEVLTYTEDGTREVALRVAGLPFSVDWLPDGRTVLATAGGVVLAGPEGVLAGPNGVLAGPEGVLAGPDGVLVPYGGTGEAWNEIVVDPRGNVFVNAPGFDLMAGEEARPGWISVVTPDRSARRVAEDLWFPNGMAVTTDGSTLIVAESYGHCLTAFDLAPDGSLSGRRVWADLGEGTPDGICLDAGGAVWYADVPHRRCVRVREGGEVLATVEADRGCFACMLGGADGRTLFVVATEWGGTKGIGAGEPTGQILTHRAPAAHAGRP